MDCETALLYLIAYCQRQGVLSSGEAVVEELADILEWDKSDVEDLLD